MTNIVIVGYGRMGHTVEAACLARGLGQPVVLDSYEELQNHDFGSDDVVIEFTQSPNCLENYKYLASQNVPIVTGTTGWLEHEQEIIDIVAEHNAAFLFAANFSIGVHIYWKLIEEAARIFDKQDRYDVYGHEVHHPHKVDSPSGTARHTADIILANMKRKAQLVTGDVEGPLDPSALHFSASRGGFQAGEHTVSFDGADDTIELTHHAKGREGFANGAIDCALWLSGKTGYFTINDYLKEILS